MALCVGVFCSVLSRGYDTHLPLVQSGTKKNVTANDRSAAPSDPSKNYKIDVDVNRGVRRLGGIDDASAAALRGLLLCYYCLLSLVVLLGR